MKYTALNEVDMYKALCVFGHWNIDIDEASKQKIYNIFEDYIVNKNVCIFYFGGFGNFDALCHTIITNLKQKYPHIKRIYVCEDYKFIDRPHKRPAWLKKEYYEDFVYFHMRYTGFYKRIYFRNCEIINNSDFCVFYVDEGRQHSGALKALQYAKRKKKTLINLFNI